jgi:hypothetical protein
MSTRFTHPRGPGYPRGLGGDSVVVRLQFANEEVASTARYSFDLLSGQGTP